MVSNKCVHLYIIKNNNKEMAAITLTPEYKKRIVSSISETERLLQKEEKYSFDLQNHELIAGYKKHLLFLADLLTKESLTPNFSI